MNSDCLVQAAVLTRSQEYSTQPADLNKTGTGKTIAFLLPAIQSMLSNRPTKGQVAILVIAPTRELALQIAAEAVQLVSRLRSPVEVHTAFGGTAKYVPLLYLEYCSRSMKLGQVRYKNL